MMEKEMGRTPSKEQGFKLNASGYFQSVGVDVMAFDDIYPEGHQSGVSIIMHGNRVATNGDIRFEQTPGQWQPVPKQGKRQLDEAANRITTSLSFPDTSRHLNGFNPMIYPDFEFEYNVIVQSEGTSVKVTVDLDRPIPDKFVGKICFNMELFPGALFGKHWLMDDSHGIFPEQPNGPVMSTSPNYLHTGNFSEPDANADIKRLSGDNKGYNPIIADDIIAEPYAVGKRFTVRPDDPYNRFTIESNGAELKLYDGRMNHNNGWFVISSEVPAGATHNAIQWVITPNVVEDWKYPAVVQTSQVGYHPIQTKTAIIELDKRESKREKPVLFKITETGEKQVLSAEGQEWGQFLRYNYLKFDFTDIKEEGLYKVHYGSSESSIFRIASDVYDRGVWQPVLEYFLPVQMCHMRVSEKYRVWHGHCHHDDARMAPVNLNHFDGYVQGPSTLTQYKPGDVVPGLNVGGWHDAGDFDLRVESQSGEFYTLALAYEAFNVNYDVTTIDQVNRIVEIHQPDGKNDILQQIEHGVLSVVGGYRALGRLYRGIIENDLRQYVHLGDSASMSDGIIGNDDDRWVFTEDNPPRELTTAAHLAAASRALEGFNNTLSSQALEAACEIFKVTDGAGHARTAKIQAATELFLTTGEQEYKNFLLSEAAFIIESIDKMGWFIARAEKAMNDADFTKKIRDALPALKEQFVLQSAETPYGIPYRPHIWGAGWGIQSLGCEYYFLHMAYPDIFDSEIIFNALNFVLGCHPGSNTMSFASGVGAKSATVGYGLNRADWSYIPGGVISGTALIRPDFPELLVFPYLWQQVEYVMGGGSTHFMFLALAAQQLVRLR
ncbi:MAG: glycoside hydrolase family 9 protein [Candidatus Cohnella colombiensis]|uniref:Glycoside hydrolase family 9 protein n=1 Tax=Candidatus Cohnella colombiensis TaxID=3121368 RepID=A0AA95JET3_9BACL|nr:MAG: glycoside hydrolase family 9 protein [Cohnella sp.]